MPAKALWTSPCMNNLKPTLSKLGLSQSELAQLLDVSARTVNQWARGDKVLPGAVAGYLRLLLATDDKVREAELERLQNAEKRLDDGLYRIGYRALNDEEYDHALAVLRSGKILGSDRYGTVFNGHYRFDRRRGLNIMTMTLDVPPDGILINGLEAGPEGAQFDVTCNVAKANPVSRSTIDIAGQPIVVELSFLGPLPN